MELPNEALFRQVCGPEYTESFKQFVALCVNRMVMAGYRYGPVTPNVWTRRDFWGTMFLRIEKCKETQNTEYLVDVANFCAMAVCFPPEGYRFAATTADQSPGYMKQDGTATQADAEDAALVEWWKTRNVRLGSK